MDNDAPFERLRCQTTHSGSKGFPVVAPDGETLTNGDCLQAAVKRKCQKECIRKMEKQRKLQGGALKTECEHIVEGHHCNNAETHFGHISLSLHNQPINLCTQSVWRSTSAIEKMRQEPKATSTLPVRLSNRCQRNSIQILEMHGVSSTLCKQAKDSCIGKILGRCA